MSSEQKRDADDQSPFGIEAHARLPAAVVYQVVRQEGTAELERPAASLWWSGVAAGFAISASPVVEGLLRRYLTDTPERHLIESVGYCAGFLMVILGRLQLFTENTITAVLPLFANFKGNVLYCVARLWGIVLLANLVGTLGAMVLLAKAGGLPEATVEAMLEISRSLSEKTFGEAFGQAIPAGFLIAAIVWLMPSTRGSEFWVVATLTYIIAIGDFTHVIAGSSEVFLLIVSGEVAIVHGLLGMILPALLGNILGGTALFAALAYAQVRGEVGK